MVFNTVREIIGNTPIIKISNILSSNVNIYAKLEFINPGGSIKDRLGVGLINEGESTGKLIKGGVIIEPTAGNTGIALALAAVGTGYKVICIVPQKFSMEKQELMKALGAEVINTPAEDGMTGAIQKAKELSKIVPNAWLPLQFTNPINPKIHYETTGPEIYNQLDGCIDIFVAGAGSAGTFMGVSKFLKEKNPNIKCVIVEPQGSIINGGKPGPHEVEGIGMEFLPDFFDRDLIDEVYTVNDKNSFNMVKELGAKEGMLVGSSSGCAFYAALEEAKIAKPNQNILVIFPDSSERYLSKKIYRGDI